MPTVSEEDAYAAGADAKRARRPVSSCPYRYRNLIVAWENGWWDADRDVQKAKS